jgi:predicted dehydrogenase
MRDIRWGIIGCGGIANTFATSLRALDSGILLAGASRTGGKAAAFAQRYGLERSYSDYGALVADPDIDAVYVATTHNFHFENVKFCLEHGKHVLCEKPFTVNANQAQALIELAQAKNLFLMEGLWTRFLPAIVHLQELLAAGAIGEVQSVYANFFLGRDFAPGHRLRNKALAGGALLDLGVYPINMASLVFGQQPLKIDSAVNLDEETGVDASSYYFFDYGQRRRAVLSASYAQAAPVEALVCGTQGFIRLPHFHGAKEMQLYRNGKVPEVLEFSYGEGENFKYEIAHAMECIAAGKTESDIMPLSETLAVMETMDALRAQWSLTYPDE